MRRIARYPLIVILLLGLVLALPLLNEHLVPAGDNSTYLVLGQALVTGRGYRMISDPRSPDMGLYPPGYPLLLAGVLALTGTQNNLLAAILPCKALSVILFLGTLVLIHELLKRRDPANHAGRGSGPMLAIAATFLAAVNPQILYYATEVGTEIPFLFFSLACLWIFERYLRKPTARGLVGTVIVLVLAFYIRSIALVMALAFALYMVLRARRVREAMLLLLGVAVLEAPWFIRGQALPDTGTAVGLGRGYFALYFTSDPYGIAPASLGDWVVRLAQNVRMYVFEIWPTVLFPHAERISQGLGVVGSAFALLLSLLLFLGFLLELGRGNVSEWYTATFFASCVTYMWAQSRLVLPIIPFAIYYFLTAVHLALALTINAIRRLASSAKRTTIYAFAVVCIVLALSALVAEARAVQRNLSYAWGKPLATYYQTSAEWTRYLQAMNWIAENGAPDSAVICRKADLMYIVTGHRALEYPYSQDGMALKRTVANGAVVYIIEDAFKWTGTTTDYLRPALRAWMAAEPQALELVFETDAPQTRVWRVERLN